MMFNSANAVYVSAVVKGSEAVELQSSSYTDWHTNTEQRARTVVIV